MKGGTLLAHCLACKEISGSMLKMNKNRDFCLGTVQPLKERKNIESGGNLKIKIYLKNTLFVT